MVEGEKCTKFLFELEKKRAKSGIINEIKGKSGEIVEGNGKVLEEIKVFMRIFLKQEGWKLR